MSETITTQKWYVHVNGAAEGPRTDEQIASQLLSGKLPVSTLAAFEGAPAWKLLSEWPEFTEICTHLGAQSSGHPPLPVLPQIASAPKRPRLLKYICWYGLAIGPALWLIGHLTCLVHPLLLKEESPLVTTESLLFVGDIVGQLIIRTMLALAALKTLRGRPTGLIRLHHMLWALLIFSLAYSVFDKVVRSLLAVLAGPEGIAPMTDVEESLYFIQLFICVVELAIVVLGIWWVSRSRNTVEHPSKGGI